MDMAAQETHSVLLEAHFYGFFWVFHLIFLGFGLPSGFFKSCRSCPYAVLWGIRLQGWCKRGWWKGRGDFPESKPGVGHSGVKANRE